MNATLTAQDAVNVAFTDLWPHHIRPGNTENPTRHSRTTNPSDRKSVRGTLTDFKEVKPPG